MSLHLTDSNCTAFQRFSDLLHTAGLARVGRREPHETIRMGGYFSFRPVLIPNIREQDGFRNAASFDVREAGIGRAARMEMDVENGSSPREFGLG